MAAFLLIFCSCRIVVIISVSQTEDAGSIPVSCCVVLGRTGSTNGVRTVHGTLRTVAYRVMVFHFVSAIFCFDVGGDEFAH